MDTEIAREIIELEQAALERWGNGDPDGFLEISDAEVAYFDPFLERRVDGVEALRRWYESVRGKKLYDRFELINPRVQAFGELAVLTFNFVSQLGDKQERWNCTEVYRRTGAGWRIIQTHWSFTQPLPSPPAP